MNANYSKTYKKGLRRNWVRKSEIVYYPEEDHRSKQWVLLFYKGKVAYVPSP